MRISIVAFANLKRRKGKVLLLIIRDGSVGCEAPAQVPAIG